MNEKEQGVWVAVKRVEMTGIELISGVFETTFKATGGRE